MKNFSEILIEAVKSAKIAPSKVDEPCETINDAVEFVEFMSAAEIEGVLQDAGIIENTRPSYSEMAEMDREERIRRAKDLGLI